MEVYEIVKRLIKSIFPWSPKIYHMVCRPIHKVYNKYDTPIIILLYHRCANMTSDPQLLGVTPEHFEDHIKWITENYKVLRFDEEWQKVTEPSVVITFDDGYEDNYLNAVPILEKYHCPATIFVTTGRLDTDMEPWCDDVERIILLNNNLLGNKVTIDLGEFGIVEKEILTESERNDLYYLVHDTVKEMQPEDRDSVLSNITDKYGEYPVRKAHRYMSSDQIKQLAASKYITIGGHTITHSKLSVESIEKQLEEIEGSKKRLEKIMGKKVITFSYPFGSIKDYNEDSVKIVRELGFLHTASNFPGRVHSNTSVYELPRQIVRDWDLTTFCERFDSFWTN